MQVYILFLDVKGTIASYSLNNRRCTVAFAYLAVNSFFCKVAGFSSETNDFGVILRSQNRRWKWNFLFCRSDLASLLRWVSNWIKYNARRRWMKFNRAVEEEKKEAIYAKAVHYTKVSSILQWKKKWEREKTGEEKFTQKCFKVSNESVCRLAIKTFLAFSLSCSKLSISWETRVFVKLHSVAASSCRI